MRGLFVITSSVLVAIVGLVLMVLGFKRAVVHEISWGSLVAVYTAFALMASGSTIVNSIYAVFGYRGPREELAGIIRPGALFSLATLIVAFLVIAADATRPWNFWKTYLYLNPESRIGWMIVIYTLLLVLLVVELALLARRAHLAEVPRGLKLSEFVVATLALITTISAASNLAQAFGTIVAVPAWFGAHLAPYFIGIAVLLGASGQVLFISLSLRGKTEYKQFLARYYSFIFAIMLPILAFFVAWNVITAFYGPAWLTYSELVKGAYSAGFWAVIFLGIVLPFALAVYSFAKRNVVTTLVASVLVIATGVYHLYLQIVVHQLKTFEELAGVVRTVTYNVTGAEVLVIVGAVLLWPALYALGARLLPILSRERSTKIV